MTHFSDPEISKIKDARKLEFDRMWRKKEILDNTYLRSLFIMGFLPDEANTELNMLKMEQRENDRIRRALWDQSKSV